VAGRFGLSLPQIFMGILASEQCRSRNDRSRRDQRLGALSQAKMKSASDKEALFILARLTSGAAPHPPPLPTGTSASGIVDFAGR